MPRRPRLGLADVPVHVIQRGHNRADCFFADRDYALYLRYLREFATEFACSVHAYCLMTNHVHLLLTPRRADGCTQLMKHLAQRYVQYVNRVYRRSGTLWEGRFRSCLVQSQDYLLACHRYIELNPVRAAMVAHPRQYRWSSYRTNAEGRSSDLIVPHASYLAIGRSEHERLAGYGALFDVQPPREAIDEIRRATNAGLILSGEPFRQVVARQLASAP